MGRRVHVQLLNDTGGTVLTNYSMSSGAYIYTDKIKIDTSTGFSSLLLLMVGSITTTLQVSVDGNNFYTPYDTDGNSLATLGTCSDTKWISFSPQLAPFHRFLFRANSASAVTAAYYMHQEA